ncbi:hypothetical protein BA011_29640 (plasmid) [Rhizobium leguminosarum]|uniref:Uncharacterized protein n=1 Tax=Rhizobium leguminosarum TaxID=384 RepID=A0A1B1CJF3_RHILE|nr:hypothetical protein BA011_29640 [Rhizobium leguminosarum]
MLLIMRHAGGLDDLVAVELLVTPIAIGMHHAAEVCEVVSRMHALAVRAIVISDGTGSGGLIATAVEDVDPDPAGFCLAPSGVENIDGGIVRMYSVKRGDMGPDSKDERRKQTRYAADPVSHYGSGDVYPQPIVHLGQAVERDVIVEFGDHDMGEQSRSGFAALDRQGWHLARHRRIALPADHALFDMADNLDRRRHVLQHLDHPVGGLQERRATTGRAIAGGRIDQFFGGKTIGQWFALRLVRRVVQLRQRSFPGAHFSLGTAGLNLLQHQFELLYLPVDLFRRRAMLPVSEQFQLCPQQPDYGVALDDLGFLLLKFRRLFCDECAQSS